ncbi:MAG: PAS domain S-box protein [Chloroflexota bacterium]
MTKVLIVDDEQENLYLLQVLLSANGYELESASNGAEALELALRNTPDVIISDILMPVMDGFSLCRNCKEDERLRDIPFIFYTATYTEPKDEALALSLGAERFIVKPAEPAQFLALLKETVAKYAAGNVVVRHGVVSDVDYYKEHTAALTRKLEDKVAELEEKNRKVEADSLARIKTEEMLRESEERFRNAFENAPIGKALIAPDGRFLMVNRALADILGYAEGELLEKTYQEITLPDDLDTQFSHNRQLLAGEIQSYRIEKRCFRKNRQVIRALLNMSLVRDKTGQPLYFIAQVQDVTKSKRMEEDLHNSVDLLNITGRIARIGGWEVILETQTLNWTEEVYRIHEVDLTTKLTVADAINFYTPESRDVISAAVQTGIDSGTPWDLELRLITAKGRLIWVHTQGMAERRDGKVTRIYGSFQDITERKIAENTLYKINALLSVTGRLARVGGWEYNLDRVEMFGTEQLYELFGVDSATPLSLSDTVNLFAPELRPVISESIQNCLDNGTPWNLELPMITGKGRQIWVSVQGEAERKEGKVIRLYGAFQDITERKLAEEQIRQQTARAQALVRTASHINSNLDLNSVLSSICEETARSLTVSVVMLYMYDPESQTASLVADYGCPDIVREKITPISIHTLSPDLSPISDAPIIISDAQAVDGLPYADLSRLLDIRSIASAKIKNKDTYIGSLSVFSIGEVRQFSDDEIALLDGLSNQAAQAITNARLFESITRRLANIESLRTIDSAIANSLDVRLTLRIVVEETVRQLGVDAADILLFEPASNLLESAVSQGFRTAAMRKTSLRIGEGIAGQIASDWQRIFIPDLAVYQGESTRAPKFAGENFVSYCGMPLRAKGQLIGVLEVFTRKRLNPDPDWFGFLETLAGQSAIAIDSIRSFEGIQISNTKLILAYDATIEGWSRAMDLRDAGTEGHTRRVTQMTIELARSLGVSNEQIVHIRRGALLHDMGKLGIPDRILLKPDKLTDEEWVIMRRHPQYAYDMLSSISYLRPALDIPYCHHEKWDGTGYPRGLKGEEIPLAARIFAVIDVWDALTSDRPYREAWSREQTLAHIREQTGTHFDPQVVKAFMARNDLI